MSVGSQFFDKGHTAPEKSQILLVQDNYKSDLIQSGLVTNKNKMVQDHVTSDPIEWLTVT